MGRLAVIGSSLAILAGSGVALHAQHPASSEPVPAATAPQQPDEAFDATVAKQVVEKLATALEENFVRPETGNAYAAALRTKATRGGYDSFPSASAFAETVTTDLQAISPDGHLRLYAPGGRKMPGAGPGRGPGAGSAISKSGWVAKGVAYINFTHFPGNEATLADLRRFLADHADASSLIIDARDHRGGGLAEMDILFAQLFGQETELLRMDTRLAVEQRNQAPLADNRALRRIDGPETIVRRAHFAVPAATPTKLRNARVFLLISGRTVSAAEHLALSLKRTKRATLIGETTRGAGNYGGPIDLGGGYSAFVPVGRTFDPDTGEGWEGVGIKPDVEVPAGTALDEALKRAGGA